MKEFKKNFGISNGLIIPASSTEKHKSAFVNLGDSDIAQLTMLGYSPEQGATPKALKFGGDGSYRAWIVDNEGLVPDYYTLVAEYDTWLKIYDDDDLVFYCYRHDAAIKVYRAGEYGCLICITTKKRKTMKYIIQDREAGNRIDEFATILEAETALAKYETDDIRDGYYEPDFYEIVEVEASTPETLKF